MKNVKYKISFFSKYPGMSELDKNLSWGVKSLLMDLAAETMAMDTVMEKIRIQIKYGYKSDI